MAAQLPPKDQRLLAAASTPIAQLNPEIADPKSRVVDGVVTITWPYSIVTKSTAFILAEHDVLLRRDKGQIRVEFHGAAGRALADSSVGGGDEIRICLDGAEWVEGEPQTRLPAGSMEWRLKFTKRLLLSVRKAESDNREVIDVDSPDDVPEAAALLPSETIATTPPAETQSLEHDYSTPIPPPASTVLAKRMASATFEADEYASPAFLKRARVSYGSLFEGGHDFLDDAQANKKRKRRSRFSMNNTVWRYSSRSPSPEGAKELSEPESPPEDDSIEEVPIHPSTSTAQPTPPQPAMVDEGSQTQDLHFSPPMNVQVSAESRFGSSLLSPTTGSFARDVGQLPSPSRTLFGQILDPNGIPPVSAPDSMTAHIGSASQNRGFGGFGLPTEQDQTAASAFGQVSMHGALGGSSFAPMTGPVSATHHPMTSMTDHIYPESGTSADSQLPFTTDLSASGNLFGSIPQPEPVPWHIESAQVLNPFSSAPAQNEDQNKVVTIESSPLQEKQRSQELGPDGSREGREIRQRSVLETGSPTPDATAQTTMENSDEAEQDHQADVSEEDDGGDLQGEDYDLRNYAETRDDDREGSEAESEERHSHGGAQALNLEDEPSEEDVGEDQDEEEEEGEEEEEDDEQYDEPRRLTTVQHNEEFAGSGAEEDYEEEYDDEGYDEENGYDEEQEEDEYDESEEQPARPPPRSVHKAPVVIDLLSDSDDEEEEAQPAVKPEPKEEDEADGQEQAVEEDEEYEGEDEGRLVEGEDEDEEEEEEADDGDEDDPSADGELEKDRYDEVVASQKQQPVPDSSFRRLGPSQLDRSEDYVAEPEADRADKPEDATKLRTGEDVQEGMAERDHPDTTDAAIVDEGSDRMEVDEPANNESACQESKTQEVLNAGDLMDEKQEEFIEEAGTTVTGPASQLEEAAGKKSPKTEEEEFAAIEDAAVEAVEKPPITAAEEFAAIEEAAVVEAAIEEAALQPVETGDAGAAVTGSQDESQADEEAAPEAKDGVALKGTEDVTVADESNKQLPTPSETQQSKKRYATRQRDTEQDVDDLAAERQIMSEYQEYQSPPMKATVSSQADTREEEPAEDSQEVDVLITVKSRRGRSQASYTHRKTRSSGSITEQHDDPSLLLAQTSSQTQPAEPAEPAEPVQSIEPETKEPKSPERLKAIRRRPGRLDPSVSLAKAVDATQAVEELAPPPTPTQRVTRSMTEHSDHVVEQRAASPKETRSSRRLATPEVTHNLRSKPDERLTTPEPSAVEATLVSPSVTSSFVEDESISTLKRELGKELRTRLPNNLSLRSLRTYLNKTTDVLAVATATPPNPYRPRHGPRDYMLELTLTDPSSAPAGVSVAHLFRPHQASLPVVHAGDVVLLRAVQVVSMKGRGFGLRVGDASAWAVFEKGDEEMLPQIKGPPVEVLDEEVEYASGLRRWWALLDDVALAKVERATMKVIQAGGEDR